MDLIRPHFEPFHLAANKRELCDKNKARVLMLHGHGQSGHFFFYKTKRLLEALQGMVMHSKDLLILEGIEVFYPNGPWSASDDPEADTWTWGRGDFQGGLIDGIGPSIDKIMQILSQHGPFVGVIGFSTGAAIAAIIASLLEHPPLKHIQANHPVFRFALCFSGFRLEHPIYQRFYNQQIKTPVLHFIAEVDTLIPENLTRKLAAICANCEIEKFEGTHHVPRGHCQTSRASRFILQALKGE